MKALKYVHAIAFALILTFIGSFGLSQAALASPVPSLPDGQTLLTYGTWGSPQRVFTVNESNGIVTSRFPSALDGSFEEPAAAGYDASTQKTWLLEAHHVNGVCELWNIDSSGGLQLVHVLNNATTGSMDFKNCWSATFNGDGTAWVFSRDAGGTYTDKLVKIRLSDGAALTIPVQVTVYSGTAWVKLEISSLSVDPLTGQLWAAAPGGFGIFKLNSTSGQLTDRINLVSNGIARNIYDMSFDSTGRLWFMSYDHPAERITHLGSIIPSDANPINTYAQSGPLTLNSSVFHTNVLWIEGVSAPNNSVSGNNEQETTLAATGNHSVSYLGFSFSIVVVGILFLALFRKAERKLRS